MKINFASLCLIICASITFTFSAPTQSVAAAKKAAAKAAETPDAVNAKLTTFGKSTISAINSCILPSQKSKEVKVNKDGSYTARYIAVDESTLKVSHKKPESSKAIQYVGFLSYHEVEYVCTAKTREAALKGPFTEARRQPLQELVKYMKGKWSY